MKNSSVIERHRKARKKHLTTNPFRGKIYHKGGESMKNKKENLEKDIHIRLSNTAYRALEINAKKWGLPVSLYARTLVHHALMKDIQKLRREEGKKGAKKNQLLLLK